MDCRVAIAPRNDDTKMEDNNHKRGRNDDIEVLNSYTTTYNNKKGKGHPRLSCYLTIYRNRSHLLMVLFQMIFWFLYSLS